MLRSEHENWRSRLLIFVTAPFVPRIGCGIFTPKLSRRSLRNTEAANHSCHGDKRGEKINRGANRLVPRRSGRGIEALGRENAELKKKPAPKPESSRCFCF